MVILRDLIMGKSRFAEFLDSPERIATNVLTSRLAQMEAWGLVRAELYESRPKRYAYKLTAKGAGLLPVLQEICRWGEANLPERWRTPERFMAMRPEDVTS